MARFVVAGRSDCRFFAQAELLADLLVGSLPDFHVRKLAYSRESWPAMLEEFNRTHGWAHKTSPLIWRELGEGNPTASLVGGMDAFAALAQQWYGVSTSQLESLVAGNAAANAERNGAGLASKIAFDKPVKVCVTGAAGQTAYNLVYSIACGDVFGPDTPVDLRLLDLPPLLSRLDGLKMELEDCAFPLCETATITTDAEVAFADCDYVVMLSAIPRVPGENPVIRITNRKDVLRANTLIFKELGLALNRTATANTKIVVVANPANTNALIISAFADKIPKENFTSLSRLDQNRVCSLVAAKVNSKVGDMSLQISGANVKNVAVWGNHSTTVVADIQNAFVTGGGSVAGGDDTFQSPALACVNDDAWVASELTERLQGRGKEVVESRKMTPALSAGRAISMHLKDLHCGTAHGEFVSMGVYCDHDREPNPFGISGGIFFSAPVTISDGKWAFAQGLTLTELAQRQQKASEAELRLEKEAAFNLCGLATDMSGVAAAAPAAAAPVITPMDETPNA